MTPTGTVTWQPRDRTKAIAAALLAATAGCWAYLLLLRSEMVTMASSATSEGMASMGDGAAMGDMAGMAASSPSSWLAMPMTSAWTGHDVLVVWTMWAVMMAAMMLPSALPMVRAYSTTVGSGARSLTGSTPAFVGAYVAAWSGFAALATGAQWALHRAALVDAEGVATNRWLAGPVLVAAGAYQFTNLKEACLGKCRAPLSFLLAEWSDGVRGALRMGGLHGALCIGCCWALMALLFVLGVMNLWWIAIVATAVLIEKVTRSSAVPKLVGAGLLAWGMAVLL
jgi:predicted metal-binding membrane protein